jgi:medium-chain acyl-[acyl-carrier-protein] hydrolase
MSPGDRISSEWLPHATGTVGARLRLFCFPYAGGSCTAFSSWQAHLTGEVQVCALEFPGRMARLRQPPISRFELLLDTLVRVLAPYLETPFAFFGYSMGALVAFELARRLRREQGREPSHLFVAARPAPHLPKTTAEWNAMTDDQFLGELQRRYRPMPPAVLADPGMRAMIIRMMRADLSIMDSHDFRQTPRLRCPITALGGHQDPLVSPADLSAWSAHTTGPFDTCSFDGDHFFLESHRSELLKIVRSRLLPDQRRPLLGSEAG